LRGYPYSLPKAFPPPEIDVFVQLFVANS